MLMFYLNEWWARLVSIHRFKLTFDSYRCNIISVSKLWCILRMHNLCCYQWQAMLSFQFLSFGTIFAVTSMYSQLRNEQKHETTGWLLGICSKVTFSPLGISFQLLTKIQLLTSLFYWLLPLDKLLSSVKRQKTKRQKKKYKKIHPQNCRSSEL